MAESLVTCIRRLSAAFGFQPAPAGIWCVLFRIGVAFSGLPSHSCDHVLPLRVATEWGLVSRCSCNARARGCSKECEFHATLLLCRSGRSGLVLVVLSLYYYTNIIHIGRGSPSSSGSIDRQRRGSTGRGSSSSIRAGAHPSAMKTTDGTS